MFVLKSLARNFQFFIVSRSFQYKQLAPLSACSLLLSKNCSAELSPIKNITKKKRRISSSSEEETAQKETAPLVPPTKSKKFVYYKLP